MGHQLGECKEKQEGGDIVWPGSNGRCVSDGGKGLGRSKEFSCCPAEWQNRKTLIGGVQAN